MLRKKLKRSQEEMVGFALIIIVVAVILLIFLGYTLKNSETEAVESYEVNSFIQAFLPYTTDCADNYEPNYYSIRELIIACNDNKNCLNERTACEALNITMQSLIETSWETGENRPVKGYELKIDSPSKLLLKMNQGNATNNYQMSVQQLGKDNLRITLNVYY